MNPEAVTQLLETAEAMKDLAKDKRRMAETRIQAADTVANLMHVLTDMQHNATDREMANYMAEMDDNENHDHPSWK